MFVKTPALFKLFDSRYLVYRIDAGSTVQVREGVDAGSGMRDEKSIYLTFDDGPVPEVTPQVLDILQKHNALATFFCVGENIVRNKTVFDEVLSAGHTIGNHTFSHLNGWKTPAGSYSNNVEKFNDLFPTKLFRPPFGRFTPSQYFLLRQKYKFVLWSVLSGDYSKNIPHERCLQNVLENIFSGAIIVFHDSIKAKENVLRVLPQVLEKLTLQGYHFENL